MKRDPHMQIRFSVMLPSLPPFLHSSFLFSTTTSPALRLDPTRINVQSLQRHSSHMGKFIPRLLIHIIDKLSIELRQSSPGEQVTADPRKSHPVMYVSYFNPRFLPSLFYSPSSPDTSDPVTGLRIVPAWRW